MGVANTIVVPSIVFFLAGLLYLSLGIIELKSIK
jgi:hypothetical protein